MIQLWPNSGTRVMEITMAVATKRTSAPLSVATFRAWVVSRPDEEHWELADGVPVMMAPPTRDHQRIASNLERLLNDALERLHGGRTPPLAAYQRIGVNLEPHVKNYDPEPDVAVVEVSGRDPRYADRFYLAGEIVSASDLPTVDSKRAIYQLHPDCVCVLVVRQDRHRVESDVRTPRGWDPVILTALNDRLILPAFGLDCSLRDIYKGVVGIGGAS